MRALLDERSRPPMRAVFGALLAVSREADIAVARVRIGALDLDADELRSLRRCRILIGRLDAHALSVRPGSGGRSAARFEPLLRFLESPVVRIRSAATSLWTPDFSIYRGMTGAGGIPALCLVGAHYFHEPPASGPSFTWAADDPAAVERASRRFEEVWAQGHDVRDAVVQAIRHYAASERRTLAPGAEPVLA